VTSIVRRARIVLDGVEFCTPASAAASSAAWYFFETLAILGTTIKLPFYLPFKNSLLVEMKTQTALVGGKYIQCDVYYGEI